MKMKISTRNKKFFANILLAMVALVLFSLPHFVFADGSFICSPDSGGGGDLLFGCFNRIYNIAIVTGSIVAVFFIAWAGYLYMFSGGNEGSVKHAKEYITTSITGIIILLAGFLVLKQINPDLLNFRSISPEQITAREWILPDGSVQRSNNQPAGGTLLGAAPTGTARELAQKILDNPNITLETVHASGYKDNANARQNIIDTAAGKAASRSCYDGAQCGTVALSEPLLAGILQLATVYKFNITELAGGKHASGSRHYAGIAFDATIVNGKHIRRDAGGADNIDPFKAACRQAGATEVLGPPEDASLHCAWPRVSGGGVTGGGAGVNITADFPTGQVRSEKSGKICDGGSANRASDVAYCDLYASEIRTAASTTGLSASIIRTLIHIESTFSMSSSSSVGAKGLMQIMDITANASQNKKYCFSGWDTDPAKNILCGSGIFKTLIDKYNGNVDLAIAEYNGGSEANQASRDCTSPQLRRWQCAFNDPAQTTCNGSNGSGGYLQTRNYVLNYKALLPKYQKSSCGQ